MIDIDRNVKIGIFQNTILLLNVLYKIIDDEITVRTGNLRFYLVLNINFVKKKKKSLTDLVVLAVQY